ncbi:MAG: class I SAM-dependent methyltransferase [Anaerolineae bacterium]|nr:class I SAM-dependent methyltransferase [Anaerolineae bacterium]
MDNHFIESDVTDAGERVTPDQKHWAYYAHLSIYNFALPYVRNKRVLDAGSGTGYGAHYLIQNGAAEVVGIDISEKAVAFSKQRFQAEGLSYHTMSLEQLTFSSATKFDVIFTSNVLEHIAEPDEFLRRATDLLTTDGIFIMAVPPIWSLLALEVNLKNPYHINNLPIQVWFAKLERFFNKIQGYRHWVKPEWVDSNDMLSIPSMNPEETVIRENDFVFNLLGAEELVKLGGRNITLVCVAKNPREITLASEETKELLLLSRWYDEILRDWSNNKDTHIVRINEDYRERAQIAERQLKQIYSTRGWKFLQKYWSFKRKLYGND